MKAVVFADRPGEALAPLTERTCLALLPVAGKPLLVHSVDSLAQAGVKDVLVVVSPHADQVEELLGEGERWGMHFEYVLTPGDETPEAILDRLRRRIDDDLLVLRGDVLRSDLLGDFLHEAGEIPGEEALSATVSGTPAAVQLLRRGGRTVPELPRDPEVGDGWRAGGRSVEIEGARLSLVDSLRAYHRANLDAAGGSFPGLVLPGRNVAVGVTVGRGSRLDLRTVQDWPVMVGSHSQVHPQAELLGNVVIGDDVVVDRHATLRSTVVLPNSYVGEMVELDNAIVWSNDLIRVDSGAVTRVSDDFLLADLNRSTVGRALEGLLHRVLGLAALVVSLPLWPLALLASLVSNPSAPFRRVTLRGNRAGRGAHPRGEFRALEAATRIPLLRHLPRLLSVPTGRLRLVGVAPLTPEEAEARAEEWEYVRDEAPVGLIGPAQLTLPASATCEERGLMDACYARTRSPVKDLGWLIRGLPALFGPRAWLPRSADVTGKVKVGFDAAK